MDWWRCGVFPSLLINLELTRSVHMSEPPCDEPTALRERCGTEHSKLTRSLARWRGSRGLFFELPGQSRQGLGQVLPLVFTAHAICVHLRRFCYVEWLDMRLGELIGYASGASWGRPSPAEQARYANSSSLVIGSLNLFSPHLIYSLSKRDADALVIVRARYASGTMDNAGHFENGRPTIEPVVGRAVRLQLGKSLPTPCLARFVSEPRIELPPQQPAVVYHLRTGYADVWDRDLRGRAPTAASLQETARWLGVACPQGLGTREANGVAAAMALQRVYLLSDSPHRSRKGRLYTATARHSSPQPASKT